MKMSAFCDLWVYEFSKFECNLITFKTSCDHELCDCESKRGQ